MSFRIFQNFDHLQFQKKTRYQGGRKECPDIYFLFTLHSIFHVYATEETLFAHYNGRKLTSQSNLIKAASSPLFYKFGNFRITIPRKSCILGLVLVENFYPQTSKRPFFQIWLRTPFKWAHSKYFEHLFVIKFYNTSQNTSKV